MEDAQRKQCIPLKDGFSLVDKILMRLGFYGFLLVAIAAIFRASPMWAIIYLAFSGAAALLVVYNLLCVYCPYPYEYATCLFFPHFIVSKVAKRRPGSMGRIDTIGVSVATIVLLAYPQYWLYRDVRFAVAFWALALPTLVAIPIRYCRRCRHRACTFNRVK